MYTDFAKAFDIFSHSKLLAVLYSYDVSDLLMSWIKEFLCNWSQSVCINKVQSAFLSVTCGVPQGSVLRSFLFYVSINDLPKCCNFSNSSSDIYLYADDAKLFSISDNCVELQKNLNLVESFSSSQLSLAPTKCQRLAIKRKDNINNQYFIGDNQIWGSATVKDLGVLISRNLSGLAIFCKLYLLLYLFLSYFKVFLQ